MRTISFRNAIVVAAAVALLTAPVLAKTAKTGKARYTWVDEQRGRWRYYTFARNIAQEAIGVQPAGDGTLELARRGAGYTQMGIWTWRAERPGGPFKQVAIQASTAAPRGTGISWELRVFEEGSGIASDWIPLQPGKTIDLRVTAEALQLRVRLATATPSISPKVKTAEIVCYDRRAIALRDSWKGGSWSGKLYKSETHVLSFSPFKKSGVESSSGIEVTGRGEVVLAEDAGKGEFVSTLQRPGLFDSFQVGYTARTPAGSRVRLQVRTFQHRTGTPSPWREMSPEGEQVLGVVCDAVQIRAELTATDKAKVPVLVAASITYGMSGEPPDIPGAVVAVPPPPIVKREDWGSLAPREGYQRLRAGKLAVHHSGASVNGRFSGASSIRGIQEFHMYGRGWNDIAYHYLVGPDGSIWQGRPEGANGSHSPPNSRKLGICVLGDFTWGSDKVSSPARRRLVQLLAYLAGKYGISSRAIYGHRDFNRTDCPGDSLYSALPDIRDETEALLKQAAERAVSARAPAPAPAPRSSGASRKGSRGD